MVDAIPMKKVEMKKSAMCIRKEKVDIDVDHHSKEGYIDKLFGKDQTQTALIVQYD